MFERQEISERTKTNVGKNTPVAQKEILQSKLLLSYA